MKALVFILVLANLLFFAYAEGYFGRPGNPDAARVDQQLNRERIRVVARGEAPKEKDGTAGESSSPKEPIPEKEVAPAEKEAVAASKEVPAPEKEASAQKPPAGPEACITWADLSGGEANRVAALLAEKFTDFRLDRRADAVEGSGWWVFIPPLPNKADAEKKVGELKRLGVDDYFIIQDAGPNRFAISLGVFTSEGGANDRLAELRTKGVKSAKVGPRLGKDALHTVEVRGPAARQAALAAAVKTAVPEIASRTCK